MRIIAVHGIGQHAADFHQAWEDALREALADTDTDTDIQVLGLHWSDEQDQVADRFPVASERLQGVMSRIGVGAVGDFRDSDAYKVIHSHVYDVFAYSFLHELRHYLQTQALRDLLQLVQGHEEETAVVAHSLGSALTVHVAALMRRIADTLPFRGAVLLAPPLGIRSPISGIPDPLAVTPDSALPTDILGLDGMTPEEQIQWAKTRDYGATLDEAAREEILLKLCNDWPTRRLHFVVNKNDIVCSDVQFRIGNMHRDVISIKQGYSERESAIINASQSFHEVTFGKPEFGSIAANHDAITYLGLPEVATALRRIFE